MARILPTGLLFLVALAAPAQEREASPDAIEEARTLIQEMKRVERGPFARIRWFCADGSVHPPNPYPCEDRGGGVQHGQRSADAKRLAELGYHVGTLFIELSYDEFFDAAHNHDRLREIVVQGYLRRADDGWVERHARTYRGARQIEDEEAAGQELLERLLSDSAWIASNFLLAQELVRHVPHTDRAPDRLEEIRRLARDLGDSLPAFQPLRTKIHSYPGPDDVAAVAQFARTADLRDPGLRAKLEGLLETLRAHYEADARDRLQRFLTAAPFQKKAWHDRLRVLIRTLEQDSPASAITALARLSADVRAEIEGSGQGAHNLRRFELNRIVQELLMRRATTAGLTGRAPLTGDSRTDADLRLAAGPTVGNPPQADGLLSRRELLRMARSLVIAVYGRGLLSDRELRAQLGAVGRILPRDRVDVGDYRHTVSYLGRVTAWAGRTIEYAFGPTLDRYLAVEPAARRFGADLLRSTALLPLTSVTDGLNRDANRAAGLSHELFGRKETGALFGLNPGVAAGTLEVVPEGAGSRIEFRRDRIYVLPRSLPDLPPVAGILTLSEGSSLSHLQLLARNLGIPNAVVPRTALPAIRVHAGHEIFYAVTPAGRVILKTTGGLTRTEARLLRERRGAADRRIRIDPSRLDLATRDVLSLGELGAGDAGRRVGPKAAGVARLARAFPRHVAPGLVIPFGAFRAHLEARVEPDGVSLYDEIVEFYRRVAEMDSTRADPDSVRRHVETRLSEFRRQILERDLDPELVRGLREELANWGPAGSFGVFVRSDTNVEDLPGFSGAGLNLTVPNVIRFEAILDAIKRVWASAFTPRAFAWRRAVLATPEHTYVAVLLQRSVPVEKSGVLITADLETGRRDRLTISAAEGVGGVVGGELAESLLVPREGGEPRLLAQPRAPLRRELDSENGGLRTVPVSGSNHVLTGTEIVELRRVTDVLARRFDPATDGQGRPLPWDIEFGFGDGKLWLFQIRPLASNTGGASVRALAALDPQDPRGREEGLSLADRPTATAQVQR